MSDEAVHQLLVHTHQDGTATPHVYSTVGLLSSSTGGALTAAPMANGTGTTLRVFCGMASTQLPEWSARRRETSII
jgi:hypothetical protein